MKKKATTAANYNWNGIIRFTPRLRCTVEAGQYGWWYEQDNGSYPAGGWELISGNWYYFNGSGYMQTGGLSRMENGITVRYRRNAA